MRWLWSQHGTSFIYIDMWRRRDAVVEAALREDKSLPEIAKDGRRGAKSWGWDGISLWQELKRGKIPRLMSAIRSREAPRRKVKLMPTFNARVLEGTTVSTYCPWFAVHMLHRKRVTRCHKADNRKREIDGRFFGPTMWCDGLSRVALSPDNVWSK